MPAVLSTRADELLALGIASSLPLHPLPRQLARLPYPGGELGFVDCVVLVDVEVADVLLLGCAGRYRPQLSAAEEGDFHVPGEAVEAEEPGAVRDAVERRVPFHGLGDAGHGAGDERVEAAA